MLSRRSFIQKALIGSTSVLASEWISSGEENAFQIPKSATDKVKLGKTQIYASFLAFGTGFRGYNRSSELTRKGKEAFAKVIERVLSCGVNFIDMADLYGSHTFVKEHIKNIPRERLVLLSKIWPRKANWVTPSGGAKDEVNRFLEEIGVEYLDVCLIHCMLNDQWPNEFKRICDELHQLKEEGKVKAVGVSCHDLGALKVAAVHPWVDIFLARINHRGGQQYACDGELEEVVPILKKARANGKAIIGMKIFGEGRLVKPEDKKASIKFVTENRLVDAITIGFLSPEEVDDTIHVINEVLAEIQRG